MERFENAQELIIRQIFKEILPWATGNVGERRKKY